MCCYYSECETQRACRRGYVSMNIYNGQNGTSCGCQNECQNSCGCDNCGNCCN